MNAYIAVLHRPDYVSSIPDSYYLPVIDAIESYKHFRLAQPTTWLITTPDPIEKVWRDIGKIAEPLLISGDRFYLTAICRPIKTAGSPCVEDWARENLPEDYQS